MRLETLLIPCVGLVALGSVAGCGGASGDVKLSTADEETREKQSQNVRAEPVKGATDLEELGLEPNRCDVDRASREVSEYDTSGDDVPDVRKVFMLVGEPPAQRTILICREADLNADGVKDVVRYYNDEGSPLREESDRDFDGQMEMVTIYQEGRIVRQEVDTNTDGLVDTRIFYEDGGPLRAERDLKGRSSASQWRPDRWEYYDDGNIVRMGTDLDGDGIVDRWQRTEEAEAEDDAERAGEKAQDAAKKAAAGGSES